MTRKPFPLQNARIWFGFAVLCMAAASNWLLPPVPFLEELASVALALTSIALFAVAVTYRGGRGNHARGAAEGGALPVKLRSDLLAWASAVGSFAAPMLLLNFGGQQAGSATAVAAMGTAPLWAALTCALGRGAPLERTMPPALAALAGALLLLPFTEPSTKVKFVGTVLCLGAAALSGASTVVCHDAARQMPATRAVILLAGSNASALTLALLLTSNLSVAVSLARGSEVLAHTLLAMVITALWVWLLRELTPVAMTTRFLWTPLLIAVQGWALFRLVPSSRMITGAILLTAGAVVLIRRERAVPVEVLSLR